MGRGAAAASAPNYWWRQQVADGLTHGQETSKSNQVLHDPRFFPRRDVSSPKLTRIDLSLVGLAP